MRRQKRQKIVNPIEPPAPDAAKGRMEIELPLLPVERAPRDRDGHPIVPTAWVRADFPNTVVSGHTVQFTGEVIKVVRAEGGRDHGRTIVYVRTEDSGRWGRVAPIEGVRVRRKPQVVVATERREAAA